MQSEGREVDQHTDNLNKIADIFSTISNHVTESNMMLHKDVGYLSGLLVGF